MLKEFALPNLLLKHSGKFELLDSSLPGVASRGLDGYMRWALALAFSVLDIEEAFTI